MTLELNEFLYPELTGTEFGCKMFLSGTLTSMFWFTSQALMMNTSGVYLQNTSPEYITEEIEL